MIPQAEISRIARRDGVQERVVEKDYALSWILIALSVIDKQSRMILKGGTALRKVYLENYRYSEDLDFTVETRVPPAEILALFHRACDVARSEVGIGLQVNDEVIPRQDRGMTFYIRYSGPLRAMIDRGEVKIDISWHELLVWPVQHRPLLKIFSDEPGKHPICVYSPQEIITEKVRAILEPARCEPRDVFDLMNLSQHHDPGRFDIGSALSRKAAFKGLDSGKLRKVIKKKRARYKKEWSGRLQYHLSPLPEFDHCWRQIERFLRAESLI